MAATAETIEQIELYASDELQERHLIEAPDSELPPRSLGRIALLGSFEGSESEQLDRADRVLEHLYATGYIGHGALIGMQIIGPYSNPARLDTRLPKVYERLTTSVEALRKSIQTAEDTKYFSRLLDYDPHPIGIPLASLRIHQNQLKSNIKIAWDNFNGHVQLRDSESSEEPCHKSLIIMTTPSIGQYIDHDVEPEDLQDGRLVQLHTKETGSLWIPYSASRL